MFVLEAEEMILI